ncbi:MAG: hypothetical protein HQL76_01425 [Magnetococcales bacterium]|nr:hypothetical protein [Magnetococcales bacterium]
MRIQNNVKEKIKNHAITQLKLRNDANPEHVNLYLNDESIDKGKSLVLGLGRQVTVTKKSALVLVDHAPLHNWGHPCELMLYDVENGEHYETHASQLPPDSYHHTPKNYTAIHAPLVHRPEKISNTVEQASIPQLDNALANVTGKRYAILFSGMSNNRHLNDLEFLYRTLINVYNFDAANITVLNYDGTVNYSGDPQPVVNWPGNNTPYTIRVNGQGTNVQLGAALDAIKGKLQANDLLLIHTNNHGGGQPSDPEAWLCCYPNWDSFTATQFGNKIGALPTIASLIVMMEQCHSGGFQSAVINNSKATATSFAAACIATANSMGGPDFDPFAKDWIAAVTGKNPNGSALSQPVPNPASARNAFDYANAVKVAGDSPVFADNPVNCGSNQYLTGAKQVIYASYNGSQLGVTLRDSQLNQISCFNTGISASSIAVGQNNDVYLTSGNQIYNFSTQGTLIRVMTFPISSIKYTGIVVRDGKVYAAYMGSQQGVTIRDLALNQLSCFNTGVNATGIAAGSSNDIYLAAGNQLCKFNTNGSAITSITFPGVVYTDVAVNGPNLYASYMGSQQGVTVRDLNLAQLSWFNTGFNANGITTGTSNDLYLASANHLYHYNTNGTRLADMTFPISSINYTDVKC